MEEEIIMETNSGLIVIKAILHLLDYAHGQAIRSDATMNMEDPFLEGYVMRQIRRMHNSTMAATGAFTKGNRVQGMLRGYFQKQISFEEISWDILQDVEAYCNEHALSYDALVVDYQKDGIPYFGVILLEEQAALIHHTDMIEKGMVNTVQMGMIMPMRNKRLTLFFYINLLNMEMHLADEKEIITKRLLACTKEKTARQVLTKAEEIIEEISGTMDSAQAVSQFRQTVRIQSENNGAVSLAKTAQEVFAQEPVKQEAFLKKAMQEALPESTSFASAEVRRLNRQQKLVTDTGIEIVFPPDYYQKKDLIEFVHHPDGTISIEIKNIGRITSKH